MGSRIHNLTSFNMCLLLTNAKQIVCNIFCDKKFAGKIHSNKKILQSLSNEGYKSQIKSPFKL